MPGRPLLLRRGGERSEPGWSGMRIGFGLNIGKPDHPFRSRWWRPALLKRRGQAVAICVFLMALALTTRAQTPRPAPAAVFEQYCVTCHNPRLKTAGLVLDTAELSHVGTNPEVWEKVVRKLRSGAMPPSTAPRPNKATYDSVSTFLETELDRAAAAKPNPGTLPLLHRLSRTEYQNAVRD